jgi:DNA-binding Lrp family transcriptional regulator
LSIISGSYDAIASIWADSTENLSMKLGEIAGIEGVRNLESFIVLRTVKVDPPR